MNKLKYRKMGKICYYFFFVSMLFAKGIGLYDGQPLFKAILVFAGISWLIKMMTTQFTKKELIITVLLLALGGITYYISGDKGLLLYVMMITGAKDLPVKSIFTVGLVTWLISFGGMFVLTATHLVDSPFKVHEKMGELIIRWGLGCSHPNVLHVSYLLLCFFLCYVLSEKMNMKWLSILMAGNLYTFLYSISFTGFVAVTVYLILCGYWIIRKKIGILEKVLIKTGAALCLLLSMLAPLLLKGKAFTFVNKLVNTRLELSRSFLTQYPFSLFGRKIADIVTYSATMDCSYVYGYVAYGVVAFVLLILGYSVIIHKFCKEQRGVELCIILACLIAGITEPFLFNTSFKNISLLFFTELIYGSGIKAEQEDKFRLKIKSFDIKKKRMLIIILTVGFLVGTISYSMFKERPERIVVPRSEGDFDESYYLELNLQAEQISEDDVIYGTPKEGTPWIALKGAAVDLEVVRGAVTSGVMTGSISTVLFIIICEKQKKKLSEKAERKEA